MLTCLREIAAPDVKLDTDTYLRRNSPVRMFQCATTLRAESLSVMVSHRTLHSRPLRQHQQHQHQLERASVLITALEPAPATALVTGQSQHQQESAIRNGTRACKGTGCPHQQGQNKL